MDGGAKLLSGVNVVEISGRMAGAYCGRLLVALGASVTRVDLPLEVYAETAVRPWYEAALHEKKLSISPDDAQLGQALGAADLIIVDVAYEDPQDGDLTATARRLIDQKSAATAVVDITQFGPGDGGPDRAGAPLVTGASAAVNWAIGDPAREPLSLPYDIPDALAGAQAAAAAALVLLGRESGQNPDGHVEIAVADVLGYYVGMIGANFVPYDRPWHRAGPQASQSGGSYPAAIFPLRDGSVSIMCRQPREWHALLSAMGNPDWSDSAEMRDAKFVARDGFGTVDPLVRAWAAQYTIEEMLATAKEHGFPIAKVRRVDEALQDPQYIHREFFHELSADDKTLTVPGAPFRVSVNDAATAPSRSVGGTAGPLSGLRVLDMTWVWSGPMVSAALRDLGADVIKIEHEARPDSARIRGGGIRDGRRVEGPPLEISHYFNAVNRGKRSLGVNIATPEGRDIVRKLARECDVAIENMRPGALSRRGLAYDDLKKENPGIVMMSMSMAGSSGPNASLAGYASVMTGLAGLERQVGYSDSPPMGVFNLALGDANAAGHALAVLLAAIRHKQRTGKGAWIDLSQMECVSSILAEPLLEAQLHGSVPAPANGHTSFAPHGHFQCAGDDSWVAVAVRTDAERTRLAAFLGETSSEPSVLQEALGRWASTRESSEVASSLGDLGIPASPLRSFHQLQQSQVASGERIAVNHPFSGSEIVGGIPWRIGSEWVGPRGRAPLLGEHTEEIARQLIGLSMDQINDLHTQGIFSSLMVDQDADTDVRPESEGQRPASMA